jgi:hypothetical protein
MIGIKLAYYRKKDWNRFIKNANSYIKKHFKITGYENNTRTR